TWYPLPSPSPGPWGPGFGGMYRWSPVPAVPPGGEVPPALAEIIQLTKAQLNSVSSEVVPEILLGGSKDHVEHGESLYTANRSGGGRRLVPSARRLGQPARSRHRRAAGGRPRDGSNCFTAGDRTPVRHAGGGRGGER